MGVTRRGAVLAGPLLALGTSAHPARADERDEKIEALERQLGEMRADQERMRDEIRALRAGAPSGAELEAAIAAVVQDMGDGAYATPSGVRRAGPALEIGGYFSTRYVSSQLPGKRGSFVDMRLVPQIHATISPGIAFDSEIEVEHAGVGGPADGEILVEYAELSFELDPAFVLKAGTLLVPFGHFNLNHDDPMNELSERPRVARFVVPSAFGLPGVGAEGVLDFDSGVLSYDVAVTNGFRDAFSNDSGARPTRGLFEDDENHDKTVFGRVAFAPTESPFDAFSIGVSGVTGRLGADGGGEHDLTGWGVDTQAKLGPWEFVGEYDALDIDRAAGTAPAVGPGGVLGPVRGLSGYYGQLLYRIPVAGWPFAGDNASVGLVVRRDHVDLNDRVRGAAPQDDERAWSFGINYRPTAKTVVKLEYRIAESGFDGPDGRKRDFFALEFATYF